MTTDDRFHRPYRVRIPRGLAAAATPYAAAMRLTLPTLVNSLLAEWIQRMKKDPLCQQRLAEFREVLDPARYAPNDGDALLPASWGKDLATRSLERYMDLAEENGNSSPSDE